MVRLGVLRISLATLALFGTRPVLADPINFTGIVEDDFNPKSANVRLTPVSDNPLNIGQASFITENGWISGWSVKDIRTSYDPASDTMSVGVNTFRNSKGVLSIVGDADGHGDPGVPSPQMAEAHGLNQPHLGGHKSVAVAFAPDGPNGKISPGIPVVVAGVPADKSTVGPGLDGFNVAAFKGNDLGLGYNFGQTLTDHLGTLAFDPSAQHPGFEFTIKNFSKIPGLSPSKGFWMSAYAGSSDDVIAGETALDLTRLSALSEQNIPEPATLLAWSLVAGGAAVLLGRKASR
ncbi:MAG: hypothetical protein NVSMB9_10990 [Isosphaeraceae bacterium]